MKRLFMFCLTISLLSSSIPVFAESSEDHSMDELDLLIAAHYFLDSEDGESYWPESNPNREVVPLYDTEGAIVAYYLEFEEVGYAVVNNNTENPTLIEFGAEDNPLIRDILDANENPHIVYNSPESLYDASEGIMLANEDSSDIYDNYPELKEKDDDLSNIMSEHKNAILKEFSIMTCDGNDDYGFVALSNMPSGKFSYDTIPCTNVNWVVTGDFDTIENHCGPVAITNLALYFASRGYTNLKKSSNEATFKAIYKITGDGPQATIAGSATTYFSNCGYTLNYATARTFSAIKTATNLDRPCGLLLENMINDWHWVLSVGYREYNSGAQYIQIMNGWNRNINRFYKDGSGSLWVSGTEYRMS